MSTLKPYSKNKRIDYDYVKEIPVDWELLPNIAIFEERIERGFINEELLSVTIGKGIIKQKDVDVKKDSSNEDKSNYKLIKKGDIAYNRMRMWQGSVGFSNYQGISSPAYVVLKQKKKINPKFYHYMFRTSFYTNYSKRFSYGIVDDQLSLRYVDFKRMYSIVPALETQNAIVNYLDKKIKNIDEFIKKKERLIELLEEKRKINIKNLVCGINKFNETQKTTIPWFKYIHKEWKLKKLKHFADTVQRGNSPEYISEDGIPVVSQAVISSGYFDQSKLKYQKKRNIDLFKGRLKNDDILVASTGGGVLGKCHLYRMSGDYIADGHVTIIRDTRQRFIPDYLFNILSINFDLIEGYLGKGSTNQTELQREWLREMMFPFPTIVEQKEIVALINKLNSEIEEKKVRAKAEIEKAKEYKQSLITHLVTGRLKVPNEN